VNQNFKKHLEASYARAFEECARTGHKIGDLDAIFNSIAMGTFAELIVRECADILRAESERLYRLSAEENDELFASNFEICAEKCVDNEVAIKEHFGVE
jgi:hypothetical protein